MGVKVHVDVKGVKDKLSVSNLKRGKYAASNQMLADMNKFVPADNYVLRNTGHIVSGGDSIEWTTPYANVQFKGKFKKYTTPGTGSRWDEKAKGLYMKSWVNTFSRGAGL